MADRVRQHVLDYLLGALDDSEMEAVKARLESDPVYRRAMYLAKGNMARFGNLMRAGGMRRDIVPPPRLAERTCEFLFTRRLRFALRSRSSTPLSGTTRSRSRLNLADLGVAVAIFVIAGFLVLPAIHDTRFAIMADVPSVNRPSYPSANQGELGQDVLLEELPIESCSTIRLGNDAIDSKDNHEVRPGLHRVADVIASHGTATVVCIRMP
ncbi:MAG: hypothetical protein WCJ35_00685 [Planctomycetota bacterium]